MLSTKPVMNQCCIYMLLSSDGLSLKLNRKGTPKTFTHKLCIQTNPNPLGELMGIFNHRRLADLASPVGSQEVVCHIHEWLVLIGHCWPISTGYSWIHGCGKQLPRTQRLKPSLLTQGVMGRTLLLSWLMPHPLPYPLHHIDTFLNNMYTYLFLILRPTKTGTLGPNNCNVSMKFDLNALKVGETRFCSLFSKLNLLFMEVKTSCLLHSIW